jgi:hypothetical protein
VIRLVCSILSLCALCAQAQEITTYSEFQRFGPLGNVVRQDYEPNPRELLSPAVPRNGHLTIRVVVNAPAHTNYFLYAGSNPPDTLKVTIYREYFARCGKDYCPDWLSEVQSPTFGAMPENVHWLANQNTRSYIFDIWVPPNVPPRRVRIEALLKTGTWLVAPLEIRVIEPTVPSAATLPRIRDVADINEPASVTAHRQFIRWYNGLPPEMPPSILRVSDLIQRNAAEDMLLAEQMGLRTPQMNFLAWTPFVFPQAGPEWYLRVRDYIFRYKR